ncbi:MAG TPA: TIGR04325 family methyltransferase [Planctomycetota bacterium]|nr:TIGR04325 family methyltransferase [Planctomycetota bacterium]
MGSLARVHLALDRAWNLTPLRQLRQRAFERRFEAGRSGHSFRGVFDSFEAAQASAPASLPLGYDNQESAEMYTRRLEIDDHDYPALFWLEKSLQEGMRTIVDLGGSVGIKYYAFRPFLTQPERVTWRVIDVPAAVERGRQLARSMQTGEQLEFSASLASAERADVLYASGSLQYLPQTLAEILGGLVHRPRRLVVNTTPIHAERSFFTLNSIGTAFCPYRIQARSAFVEGVESRGYRLRAQWKNVNKHMDLPFESGLTLEHYSGFCFDEKG